MIDDDSHQWLENYISSMTIHLQAVQHFNEEKHSSLYSHTASEILLTVTLFLTGMILQINCNHSLWTGLKNPIKRDWSSDICTTKNTQQKHILDHYKLHTVFYRRKLRHNSSDHPCLFPRSSMFHFVFGKSDKPRQGIR